MPSRAAQEWLDKAVEDEQTVAILRAAHGPWAVAAYHVQQAAEKYIKAALVDAGVPPPKSHDLPQLLSLFPGGGISHSLEAAAAMTSAYAWLTRYPGAPPILEAHVAQAEADLGLIKQWALSNL